MYSFRADAFGFIVQMTSESASALNFFQRYLLPSKPLNLRSDDVSQTLNFALLRFDEAGQFELRRDDASVAASDSIPYLFTLLQQGIDEAMIRSLVKKCAVHAGTVVWKDRAIILPAASRSGKTSLICELVRRGAEYCSDEYAVIDTDGLVHPYPRALMMRNDKDEQHPLLPRDIPGRIRTEPAPLALILFLKYERRDRSGNPLSIEILSQSESFIRLLQNTPQVLAETPEVLGPLKAGVLRASSYAGTRGETAEAAAQILEMAEHLEFPGVK